MLFSGSAGIAGASGPGVIAVPRPVGEPPSFVKGLMADVDHVASVDLDGDAQEDFLVVTRLPEGSRLSHRYLFVSSRGEVIARRDFFRTPLWSHWLADLDEDPMMEFILYTGYEDGAEFILYSIDGVSASLEKRLTFLPVFRSGNAPAGPYSWALAREIVDGSRFLIDEDHALECSFEYDARLLDYSETSPRPPQTAIPVLFLERATPIEGEGLPIRETQKLILDRIVERAREADGPKGGALDLR
jgi:hypothetical protein